MLVHDELSSWATPELPDMSMSLLRAPAPERLTDVVPVKQVDAQPLPVTHDGHTPIRAAKKVKKKAAPKKAVKADAPSIREWLEARLAKGELKVEDALAYAEKTGRSKVRVYRQAQELGYSARKSEFVKAKVRS